LAVVTHGHSTDKFTKAVIVIPCKKAPPQSSFPSYTLMALTTAYHPQADGQSVVWLAQALVGQSERMNRTIEEMLKILILEFLGTG